MDFTYIFLSILPTVVGIIGVWVNLNAQISRLTGQVERLEGDRDDLKQMVKEVVEMVHEIKIILAKNKL